jgi:deoxyribodipyrimidine photo-lyase
MANHNNLPEVNVVWFRRDLRLEDNAALYHALKSEKPVIGLFVFDENILKDLPKDDARLGFIYNEVLALRKAFEERGGVFELYHTTPEKAWAELLTHYQVEQAFAAEDYEAYAISRDKTIDELIKQKDGRGLELVKDQVINRWDEVLKDDQTPYGVYTPYSRKWLSQWSAYFVKPYPSEAYLNNLYKGKAKTKSLSLEDLGFQKSPIPIPSKAIEDKVLIEYGETRNNPSLPTSRMGLHLRFGTVSTRLLVARAHNLHAEVYLKELIWREFFMQLMWYRPETQHQAGDARYDRIPWRNAPEDFARWCEGQTGVPMVDAGMRELNATGFMHNRVRMLTASYLCKHLLIDWRLGEAYFAEKLLDYEQSSNVGNWQWVAGSGADSAPYFRIFNPTEQQKKFDPRGDYVRLWVPELDGLSYPQPMVDHKFARERALATYKAALTAN